MLADAEMQIPAAGGLRLEIPGARELERGPVRGPDIGRAAQKPGHVARNRIERCAGGIAAGDSLGIRRKYRQVPVPPLRKLPALHLLDFCGESGISQSITGELFQPRTMSLGPA